MQRVRIRGKPRQYEEADGSIGRFGQVNERTHWLYANYPCLAVYIQRIDADWAYTMDPNFDPAWDLPESIQPDEDDAGLPTPNLLGYGLAKRLTPIQIQWLQEAGYNGEELGTEHPSKRNARPSRGMQDLRGATQEAHGGHWKRPVTGCTGHRPARWRQRKRGHYLLLRGGNEHKGGGRERTREKSSGPQRNESLQTPGRNSRPNEVI